MREAPVDKETVVHRKMLLSGKTLEVNRIIVRLRDWNSITWSGRGRGAAILDCPRTFNSFLLYMLVLFEEL
jgi:hypothetical protein